MHRSQHLVRRHPDPMSTTVTVCAATIGLLVHAASADALSYVESSSGLGTPALEGGRTELEMADVNADGHVDILSIGDHGNPFVNTQEHGVMVWFGNGTGASWSVFQFGNFGYGGLAVGDVNGDGLLDVGYGMHHNYSATDLGDQILEVALGDGTGTSWTAWDDGLASNGEDWGMFGSDFADLDNDGDLDLGSVSFGCCAGVHVYLNQGDGTWEQSFGFLGGNSTMEFVFGDVNADGNADLASGIDAETVYLGDGLGGFTPGDGNLPYGTSGSRPGVDLRDVNGDGADDIAFTNPSDGVEVWLSQGSGSWQSASVGLPATGAYGATQLLDLDGDSVTDLAAFGGGTVTVWRGDGAGTWTQATSFIVGSPGYYKALRTGGDTDHNGFPDIALVEEQGSFPSYQNHLKLYKETTVPLSLAARVVEPGGGERWRMGSAHFIDWAAAIPGPITGEVQLELSTTGPGGPWSLIASDLPANGRYQWLVSASEPANDCHIRLQVTAGLGSVTALSRSFTILPPSGVAVPSHPSPTPETAGGWSLAAHPQPARGGAWLSWTAPSGGPTPFDGGELRLEVYDAGGRQVRDLRANAARSRVFWDGRDATGHDVPSGVYVVRVRVAAEPDGEPAAATATVRIVR